MLQYHIDQNESKVSIVPRVIDSLDNCTVALFYMYLDNVEFRINIQAL